MKVCCIRHAVELTNRRPELWNGPTTIPSSAPADCGKAFEQFIAEWSAKISAGKKPQKGTQP